MKSEIVIRRSVPLAILTVGMVLGTGCRNPFLPAEQPAPAQQPAPSPTPTAQQEMPAAPTRPDDQQLTSGIQAKLAGESALSGQNIQVTVVGGVATLTGKVENDASRALAAADGASVDGVRTVVNNLTVAPTRVAAKAAPERRHREVAQAGPPPAQRTPMAPPPQEQVQTVAPAAAPSCSGSQDGDPPVGHAHSDSHDRYAG